MSALFFIAAFTAYFIKGLSGFANTIVFTTMLSLKTDNINISPLEILIAYPSDIIIAVKFRKKIMWKECVKLAILLIAGAFPGIFFLKNGNPALVKCILGLTVIVVGIDLLLADKRKKDEANPALLMVIGIASGILCGMFGIGALLASYVGRTTKDTESFKANMNVLFAVDGTMRIIMYAANGMITEKMLWYALKLMPCMVVGLLIGIQLAKKLPDKLVRKIIIIMLIGMGLVILATVLASFLQ